MKVNSETTRQPRLTVDIIIEYGDGIILIKRKNPPYGWAIPGGFVDYGETVEESAKREAKEETSLDIEKLRQEDKDLEFGNIEELQNNLDLSNRDIIDTTVNPRRILLKFVWSFELSLPKGWEKYLTFTVAHNFFCTSSGRGPKETISTPIIFIPFLYP